uniref:Uncharacterized protein n=1 Tax=Rhizophora mucronata TaxID=61149 RepID=A0A2P2QS46_RHIMU
MSGLYESFIGMSTSMRNPSQLTPPVVSTA